MEYTESVPTSIQEMPQHIAMVYPDPEKDFLSVGLRDYSGKILTARIINVLGQVIALFPAKAIRKSINGVFTLNPRQIPAGLYRLQVQTSGRAFNQKILISK